MPKVKIGKKVKKFPYTKSGKAAAKKAMMMSEKEMKRKKMRH